MESIPGTVSDGADVNATDGFPISFRKIGPEIKRDGHYTWIQGHSGLNLCQKTPVVRVHKLPNMARVAIFGVLLAGIVATCTGDAVVFELCFLHIPSLTRIRSPILLYWTSKEYLALSLISAGLDFTARCDLSPPGPQLSAVCGWSMLLPQ